MACRVAPAKSSEESPLLGISLGELWEQTSEFPFGVQIGPHRLRMLMVPRELLPRNKASKLCLETGTLSLDNRLAGQPLAAEFVRAVITGSHYCHGVTERDISEETFTHSASSAFVTFAQANPVALAWWLSELDPDGSRGFLRAMLGQGRAPAAPKRVVVKKHGVRVEPLPPDLARRHSRYGEYEYASHTIRYLTTLQGPTLATILLHELLHALHDLGGIAHSTNWRVFCRHQPRLLVEFATQNPSAWRFVLWHAFHHASLRADTPETGVKHYTSAQQRWTRELFFSRPTRDAPKWPSAAATSRRYNAGC